MITRERGREREKREGGKERGRMSFEYKTHRSEWVRLGPWVTRWSNLKAKKKHTKPLKKTCILHVHVTSMTYL